MQAYLFEGFATKGNREMPKGVFVDTTLGFDTPVFSVCILNDDEVHARRKLIHFFMAHDSTIKEIDKVEHTTIYEDDSGLFVFGTRKKKPIA